MGDYYGTAQHYASSSSAAPAASAPAPQQQQQQSTAPPSKPTVNIDRAKIFVGGLSWSTTEESLRIYFEQFGPVTSVEIMRDRVTGDPRGFAFVVFDDDATVDLILSGGDRHEVDRKLVEIKRAQARGMAPPSIHRGTAAAAAATGAEGEGGGGGAGGAAAAATGGGGRPPFGGGGAQQSDAAAPSPASTPTAAGGGAGGATPEALQNKLFIGGLHLAVDKEEMKRHFERYGRVVDAIVMMDPIQRRSRGFGFVTYEAGSGGAQAALAAVPHSLRDKYVELKLAQPKVAGAGGGGHHHGGGGGGVGGHHGGRGGFRGGGDGGAMGGGGAKGPPVVRGEFYGLGDAFGKAGWKAGYGTKAFGRAGWEVEGWEDFGGPESLPERTGFSFDMLKGTPFEVRTASPTSEGGENKRQREHESGGERAASDSRESKRPRQ